MLTKFFVEEVPESLRSIMQKPAERVSQKQKRLYLPVKNHLLPKNFEIKPLNPEFTAQPVQISTWADTDVWFKQDDLFQHPKGIVHMKYHTKDLKFGESIQATVFAHIWQKVQNE